MQKLESYYHARPAQAEDTRWKPSAADVEIHAVAAEAAWFDAVPAFLAVGRWVCTRLFLISGSSFFVWQLRKAFPASPFSSLSPLAWRRLKSRWSARVVLKWGHSVPRSSVEQ